MNGVSRTTTRNLQTTPMQDLHTWLNIGCPRPNTPMHPPLTHFYTPPPDHTLLFPHPHSRPHTSASAPNPPYTPLPTHPSTPHRQTPTPAHLYTPADRPLQAPPTHPCLREPPKGRAV